jgi:hypothetical protein
MGLMGLMGLMTSCLYPWLCVHVAMGVYGCIWVYMVVYGCIWVYMGVYGFADPLPPIPPITPPLYRLFEELYEGRILPLLVVCVCELIEEGTQLPDLRLVHLQGYVCVICVLYVCYMCVICVYVCVWVCMYVCMYVSRYLKRHQHPAVIVSVAAVVEERDGPAGIEVRQREEELTQGT